MRRSFLFVITFFFAAVTYAQEITTLRIDPTTAMGGSASQLIENVSFTVLESTPESVFGSIEQLVVTPEYYIILDRSTNAVLIFDKAGKYHAKIKARAVNSGNNYYMNSFSYDKFNQLIRLPDGKEAFCFDTDGKFIKKINTYSYGYDMLNIAKGKTAGHSYGADRRNKDSIAYQVAIMDEQGISQKHLPYNFKYAPIENRDMLYSNHSTFYPTDDTAAYFVRPYDFNVYYLSAHTFYPVYRFVFPMSNTLPRDFPTDSSLNGKRIACVEKNKTFYYNLDGIFKMGNNLFFRPCSYSGRNDGYVYNLATKHLIALDKITADERTHFLFITDSRVGGVDFANHNFLATDSTSFYTSYSSLVLFQQKEATADKKPVYPPALASYFQDAKNRKGNPVIIKVTFKAEM
ncbi:6-bladed beta-propeller [Chitinophaga sp. RAB17]|uniref:6-bladed beta-propeller n=1 Tax=Chitinophaga sp. RAB17 TaxID=3233049 RepID=UPI003F8FF767